MTLCTDASKVDHVYRLGLAQPDEVPRFLQEIKEVLNLTLPGDYLHRATILVLRDQNHQLCGGCLVVLEPEFRSLQSIPPEQKFDFPCSPELVAEVNALWLSPRIKSPILPVTFWRQLALFLMATNREQILFTYDHRNLQMQKLASWLRHQVIYSGRTIQLEGMPEPTEETIALVSRNSLQYLQNKLDPHAIGSAVPRYDEFDIAAEATARPDLHPAVSNQPGGCKLGG